MNRPLKRCAIYTRKSTEDGLEQEFNSLHAQREACEAFIASQKSEGWKVLPDLYDDGGVSGGSLERSAIQRLLCDIDAGRVDIVVVYKIDRLTRSLADFAKIVDRFDAHDVSFVSVTQQFNTSTSMGRLTLNVLLSFAQFEREVTAERIRDKIAASKKKGLWMGGNPPLGYDAVDKKLVINPAEARIVRQIYDAFGSGTCVKSITADLTRRGITSKVRANGRGGKPFSRGAIYKILSSPIYRGLVRQGDSLHDGVHEAIIDDETWRAASDRLAYGKRRDKGASKHPSPLAGKITADGHSLTPSHATKNGRRYRYYISRKLTEGSASDTPNGWRLPAAQVEETVSKVIIEWLQERPTEFERTPHDSIDDFEGRRHALQHLLDSTEATDAPTLLWDWSEAISTITISETAITLELIEAGPLADLTLGSFPVKIERDIQLARRGIGRKLILGNTAQEPLLDPVMIKLIKTVRRWRDETFENGARLKDLAMRDGIDQGDASRFFQLAFLAPDITLAILDGRQPVSLTAERLKRLTKLPIDWGEQRALLGFQRTSY